MTEKRPPEAKDLYRLRLISDPQISPDGKRIAFVLRRMDEEQDDYVSNIHIVDRAGNVSQFTSGEKDSVPRWSPDGKQFAFLSGRKEKAQIHLMSTAGGESVALTERKLGAGVPYWSPDSTTIAFIGMVSTDPEEEKEEEEKDKDEKKTAKTKIVERASYKEDGAGYTGNRRTHLFVVNLTDREPKQLTDGDFFDNFPAWSPDGRTLAFSSNRAPDWDYRFGNDVYAVSSDGGDARRITAGQALFLPVFSRDGSRIACAGRQDPRDLFLPWRLYTVDAQNGDVRDEQGDWDWAVGNDILSDVAMSEGDPNLIWRDEGIYFMGAQRGEANVYRVDVVRGESSGTRREACLVEAVTTGKHNLTSYSMADDGTIAYACNDSTRPAEVFIFEGGRPKQLTHQNDELLAEIEVQRPERMSFAGADDEEGDGWLLRPRGHEEGKHPLLIYIHGGPMSAHGETFFFEYQFLAGRGYGVFFPNIHGSATYGAEYQKSIWRDWGNKDFQDVMAGTREAMKQSWVDPERVGILGGSYGGYMTLWAMAHSDLFRAGVTERCLCNFVSFIGTSDTGWAWNLITGVFPEEDVQKLWDMSPLKHVANVQAPLMVIHYEGDDRAPIEQGEQAFNALRRLGKTTKFVVYPEESHGMTRGGKPSRRVERMGIITDWFDEHLKGS